MNDILPGRASFWTRLFSPRERWFDRHRDCDIAQEIKTGYGGSRFTVYTCRSWRKGWKHTLAPSWYDPPYPFI